MATEHALPTAVDARDRRSVPFFQPGISRIVAAAALGLGLLPFANVAPIVVAIATGGAFVALTVIDIRRRLLPNRIIFPATAFVLVAQLGTRPERMEEWLAAPLVTFGFLLLLALPHRGGLGMGDVKAGLLIGAALGKGAVLSLTVAFLAAPVYALLLIVLHGRAARSMTMPFGPFLALGTIVALAAGMPWEGLGGQ